MNNENEIKHRLLDICKVKSWDSDINIVGFHALCDELKALGADEEREACAKVCEKVAVDVFTQLGREHEPYMKATAEDCAMHIRARGQPKRPWVGLTREEQGLVYDSLHNATSRKDSFWVNFANAIEAKLRELNT